MRAIRGANDEHRLLPVKEPAEEAYMSFTWVLNPKHTGIDRYKEC